MMESVVALPNRSELRRFVRQVLSDHDRLDSAQCPFYEAIITRSGRVCGLAFELQGPRLMRSRAIWAADEHRILFYDTIGARFAEVQLSEEPDPAKIHEEYERSRSEPQPALAERSDRLPSTIAEEQPMTRIQA
jgi:hypothetical protein